MEENCGVASKFITWDDHCEPRTVLHWPVELCKGTKEF